MPGTAALPFTRNSTMPNAVSIHVGVNRPAGRHEENLVHSEASALRMANLAGEAGFGSILAMCGQRATRKAVVDELEHAAQLLGTDDRLLVTFSGHGCEQWDRDTDARRERSGQDQGWCLADGTLLDDQLAECWRRFKPGVRIVIVSESCYSGDVARDEPLDFCRAVGATLPPGDLGARGGGTVYRDGTIGYADGTIIHPDGRVERPDSMIGRPGDDRGGGYRGDGDHGDGYRSGGGGYAGGCVTPPTSDDGIQARVLLLAACKADQKARDGLFSCHLLFAWNGGAFKASYCDLFQRVKDRVMADGTRQEPHIMVLGAGDLAFAQEPAFHVPVYRDGGAAPHRGP